MVKLQGSTVLLVAWTVLLVLGYWVAKRCACTCVRTVPVTGGPTG